MDLQTKIGQLFIFALYDTMDGGWRHQRQILERFRPGGFIVNSLSRLKSRREIGQYTARLQEMAAEIGLSMPLILCVDHRGGDSAILHPGCGGLEFPAPLAQTAIDGDFESIGEEIGAAIGRDILDVGFNLNLAPYADILQQEHIENFVFGNSMMGSDPEVNSALSVGLIRGMQRAGLGTTYCVFPGGYGSLNRDPHYFPGVIDLDRETLEKLHLRAARAAIGAGVECVMLSHYQYPALDPESRPATYSPAIIQDVLREEMGFDGLIMTDAIRMRSVVETAGSREEAVVRAVEAGADVILSSNWEDVAALEKGVRSGRISERRLDEAVQRVLALKKRLSIAVPGRLEGPDPVDQGRMSYLIGRSITWFRKPGDWEPLSVVAGRSGRVVAAARWSAFLDAVASVGGDSVELIYLPPAHVLDRTPQETALRTLTQRSQPGDLVLFGTSTPEDLELAKRLSALERQVWVCHSGVVSDVRKAKEMPVVLLAYSHQPVACRKAVEVLYGRTLAAGKLPVRIE